QKKVWEVLPADQKQNLTYFFPLEETIDRKPLWNVLKDAVLNKKITEVYDDETFKQKLDLRDLETKCMRTDTSHIGKEQVMVEGRIDNLCLSTVDNNPGDVKEYGIMGMWYFDRNAGELKYRLLGIPPVVTDIATKGEDF